MGMIGISVTKETAFRDSVQPFSNVYYYTDGGIGGAPSAANAEGLLDQLVVIEKTFHTTLASFVYGRVWWQTPVQAITSMLVQKPLTGAGSAAAATACDKERAYLFRRRAGTDSRGQPVYLRKYYHCDGSFPGSGGLPNTILQNLTGFSSAQRTAMANAVQAINSLTFGGQQWTICARSGRDPTETNWEAHRYLEHHQMGDVWRGA